MINDVEQFVICWFYIWIFSFVKSFSIFLLGCVPCFYQFVEVLYILDTIHSSEKAMATHSSTLAWKIPWTEEPGRLQYMGSRRVGHDWSDLAAAEMAPDSARERDWNKFFSERKWHVGTQRKGSYDMLINNKHVFSCLSWHWAPKTCNFSSD